MEDQEMCKSTSHPLFYSILGAAVIAATALLGAGLESTRAQFRERPGFTNASLSGSYAVVGTGGANDAASVGVTKFDGAGGASRTLVLNEADPNTSGRIILTIPAAGTYAVTPEGMGTAIFINELPDGSKIPFDFDFVITSARRGGPRGALLAEAIHMVQREPGIAAKLVIFQLTRLSD